MPNFLSFYLIFKIFYRLHVGPWLQSVLQRELTQMAEPYAPVIDGEAVTDDTFGMILEGIVEKVREKVTYQIHNICIHNINISFL